MRGRCRRLASTLALWLGVGVYVQAADVPFASDYGGTGLWQTPTARFGDEGLFTLGIVGNAPYDRLYLNLVPVSWLEATFRYTEIVDRLYSDDPRFSGHQNYKDRGFDVRMRLVQETNQWPAVALGFRDSVGTGLFSSQYLVTNRAFYDFDFSLGLGWGRLGAGSAIPNPLHRNGTVSDTPGGFDAGNFFNGPKMGIFGGVSWQSPIDGLDVVAEYDPNDYQHEPLGDNRKVRLPVNFGFKYRLPYGLLAGLSYQRGSILSFQLGTSLNFGAREGVAKVLDPPPPPTRAQTIVAARRSDLPVPGSRDDVQVVAGEVQRALQTQRISLDAFALSPDGQAANLWIAPGPYRDPLKLTGRSARAASAVLPDAVNRLTVTEVVNGVETYDAEMPRGTLETAATDPLLAESFTRVLDIKTPDPDKPAPQRLIAQYPRVSTSINPVLRSSIGGPDQFYFGQLWLKVGGNVDFTSRLSVSGQLGFNLYNNFGSLKLESNSELPHVRSDIKDYLKEGQQALVRLETNYIDQLAPRWYGRVSAGIFEEMYGGVAGEVLYRPDDPRWAVGLNVNRVRQRAYDQWFQFRDYEATTGNLTGYFELPKSVLAKLSVGQYLAGDRGGTVDISRLFPSGVRIGVFATKTNVSSAQFGEGSFDKGFYIVIPLDFMVPRSSNGSGTFLFRPLTRDGGQMVRDGRPLYDITNDAVRVRLPERESLFFE